MKAGTSSLPQLTAVRVLDQLRERVRYLHYSLRTEQTCVYWVRFFIRFHGRRLCFGVLRGRIVVVGYSPRGADRHVFSMRKANDREKTRLAPRLGL